MAVGTPNDIDSGIESGSVYAYRLGISGWGDVQKITAFDADTNDHFGYSVSISGDKMVVGAYGDDDNGLASGSVYTYTWNGSSWGGVQKITAFDGTSGDRFGYSVSMSGDKMIVGSYFDNGEQGSVYSYVWSGSSWGDVQKITAFDAAAGDYFGVSVSISGDKMVVGAYGDDDNGSFSGSVYTYTWNVSSWGGVQKITAFDGVAGDQFGYSVSMSGDRMVVGAFGRGNDVGLAYTYVWGGSSWGGVQEITAFDADVDDFFGYSVSISGDIVAIGSYGSDGIGSVTGAMYVYQWNGSWVFDQKIWASDGLIADQFGHSVSVSGNYAMVGAPLHGVGNRGAVYVYDILPCG